MPPVAVISGAAPAWVGERLAGPRHRGVVVHAGADALYVESRGDVIGLLSRHATPVPCAIATRAESLDDLMTGARPAAGDPVQVGAGRLDAAGVTVRVTRFLDFTMPAVDRTQVPAMVARLGARTRAVPHDALPMPLLTLLTEHPVEALDRLLGRGPGLTPFGDDVVCGMLATLLAVQDPCAHEVRRVSRALAPARTTALSATLLHRAGEGDVLPAFAGLVAALLHRPEEVEARAAQLRRVGHTSGVGMLLGLRTALDHTNTRRCP